MNPWYAINYPYIWIYVTCKTMQNLYTDYYMKNNLLSECVFVSGNM